MLTAQNGHKWTKMVYLGIEFWIVPPYYLIHRFMHFENTGVLCCALYVYEPCHWKTFHILTTQRGIPMSTSDACCRPGLVTSQPLSKELLPSEVAVSLIHYLKLCCSHNLTIIKGFCTWKLGIPLNIIETTNSKLKSVRKEFFLRDGKQQNHFKWVVKFNISDLCTLLYLKRKCNVMKKIDFD